MLYFLSGIVSPSTTVQLLCDEGLVGLKVGQLIRRDPLINIQVVN